MEMVIRKAQESDFDALNRIFQVGDRHHSQALPLIFRMPESGEEVRPREYLQSVLNDEHSAILLAESAEDIVGAIHITIQQSPAYPITVPRRFAVIENIVVAEAHRRCGIGKMLMARAHQWAGEHGISQLELNVWNFNQDAIRFYESLGYETASRRMWITL